MKINKDRQTARVQKGQGRRERRSSSSSAPVPTKRIVAAEVLTSGVCNFNCRYCYIPKTDAMEALHNQITRFWESGDIISALSATWGENLEHLGLWGTEPTLVLPLVQKRLPELLTAFPKLKTISFSTNLFYYQPIIDLAEELARLGRQTKRPLTLDVQVSLDGPAFVTDWNRQEGATKRITENVVKLIEKLRSYDLESRVRFKPTWSHENFPIFIEKAKIQEYFDFFAGLLHRCVAASKDSRVRITRGASPTLALPGKYTVEDGRAFAQICKNLYQIERERLRQKRWEILPPPLFREPGRLLRLIRFRQEISIKPTMFTCSGGDSQWGLDDQGELHLCHRTFYLNRPEYVASVLATDIENWDVSLFQEGKVLNLNKHYMIPSGDELEWLRLQYVLRGYHDYISFRLGYVRAMAYELALQGQIDPIYLSNDELVKLFGLFISVVGGCPMENILNTGNKDFIPVSLFRIFLNGAFRWILKYAVELLRD